MSDDKQQNWIKRHPGIFVTVAVVIISLGLSLAYSIRSKRPSTAPRQVLSQQPTTSNTSAYKLGPCTPGTSQTIGNANYVVGTDLAPGNYKIVSQPAGIDWTNINIYNSKAEYVKEGSPSIELGTPDTSLAPDNNVPTYTKLTDGQYMQVDADPAIFTCQ